MRKKLSFLALAAFAAMIVTGPNAAAQDLATLGITLQPPPGWTIVVQPDGTAATIAPGGGTGARIRIYVDGPALSVADAPALRAVEEPADTRIGGRVAVAVGVVSPSLRSRVFTTVSSDGRSYRFDLEAPLTLWDRHAAEMDAALASVRFGPVALAAGGGAPPTGGAAPPASAAAGTIDTGGPTFREGQPIPVNFSNLPGTYDWITIVPAGTPDDQFAEWYWSDGSNTANRPAGTPQRSGRIVFQPLPPGSYEVRLYHDWPNGGYRVRGRRAITVVAAPAVARPAAPPDQPAPAPARPAAAAGSAFVGEWRTESSGFQMTVRLWAQGDVIMGTYDYQNGVIENGRLSGVVLDFTFRDASGVAGVGRFLLASDGVSFTGTWQDRSSGRTGTWSGVRADAAPTAGQPALGSLGPDFPSVLYGSGEGWTSTWTRRGQTDVFDVVHQAPAGFQVVTVEQFGWRGQRLTIQRLASSDNIQCQMEGALTADRTTIEATGSCPGVNAGWRYRLSTVAPGAPAAAAMAPPACDIAGAWHASTAGLGDADWIFTPLGTGWYDARETGLGNARGRVFVNGWWIRAEVTTADGSISGTYDWQLGADCASAAGRLVFTAGRAGTHENSVIRRAGAQTGASLSVAELAGTWRWFSGHRVVFASDARAYAEGTDWTARVQILNAGARQFRLTWSHGYVDDLVLRPDGQRMEGRNQAGVIVWGDREGGQAAGQAACDISGSWDGMIQGHGPDRWTFTRLGDGRYRAEETGLGYATGTATVEGYRLSIEWQTGAGAGTLWVDLDASCSYGSGANDIRSGATGRYPTTLQRSGSN